MKRYFSAACDGNGHQGRLLIKRLPRIQTSHDTFVKGRLVLMKSIFGQLMFAKGLVLAWYGDTSTTALCIKGHIALQWCSVLLPKVSQPRRSIIRSFGCVLGISSAEREIHIDDGSMLQNSHTSECGAPPRSERLRRPEYWLNLDSWGMCTDRRCKIGMAR